MNKKLVWLIGILLCGPVAAFVETAWRHPYAYVEVWRADGSVERYRYRKPDPGRPLSEQEITRLATKALNYKEQKTADVSKPKKPFLPESEEVSDGTETGLDSEEQKTADMPDVEASSAKPFLPESEEVSDDTETGLVPEKDERPEVQATEPEVLEEPRASGEVQSEVGAYFQTGRERTEHPASRLKIPADIAAIVFSPIVQTDIAGMKERNIPLSELNPLTVAVIGTLIQDTRLTRLFLEDPNLEHLARKAYLYAP